jgi:hypothetical protein
MMGCLIIQFWSQVTRGLLNIARVINKMQSHSHHDDFSPKMHQLTDPILNSVAALMTDAKPVEESDFKEIEGIGSVRTGNKTSKVTPENIACQWMVGLELP